MFPGFYIPTVFVKTGIWLEEGSPESVPALCYNCAWQQLATCQLAG